VTDGAAVLTYRDLAGAVEAVRMMLAVHGIGVGANVAEHLTAEWSGAFSVVEDPEGARRVVGLQVHAGHEVLAVHHSLLRLAGDYGPRSVDLPTAPGAGEHEYWEAFGAKVRFRRGSRPVPTGSTPTCRRPRSAAGSDSPSRPC
jgi:hypothetical protein